MIPTRETSAKPGENTGMHTLVRALRVLRTIGQSTTGISLQELCDTLEIPLASAHRVLMVLQSEGFVTRSPVTKRFFVGPDALPVGEAARLGDRLCHIPPDSLIRAAALAGETVFLTELIGEEAVCVAIAECKRPLRLFVRLGQQMPVHAAASARTLLTDYTIDDVRDLLGAGPFESYTDATPRSVEAVMAHLRAINSRGFDCCKEELDEGVWAISAPIRDQSGRVRQSITIAAPEVRMRRPAAWELIRRTVLQAAVELSAVYGLPVDGQEDE